jgi:hypothetical protein
MASRKDNLGIVPAKKLYHFRDPRVKREPTKENGKYL